MKPAVRIKLVILLCFVGLTLWLWGINFPYTGTYNANNNYLALAAKNYFRFGFTTLKGFPTYFAGQRLPSPVPYYLHHPILIFPLSAIPFMLFGFRNWVVHVTNFLFLIGDILLIYKIGELVWSRKVGLWAAGLAGIFPMTTFFWKYIFFEQGSLFFNLAVFYFLYRYLAKRKTIDLALIALFTFLSGLIDWGVLYLLAPFLVLFFIHKKKLIRPFIAYLVPAGISIGLFILSVYWLRGGFTELRQAVGVHGYTDTLLSLPFWPIRLLAITLLRFIIYFTPLSLLWFKTIRKSWVLLFFFLFGCMNIFVLPSVTWENGYFLFYFIPFLTFSGALWMADNEKNEWRIILMVLIIIISSIAVNYFKIQQVKKQLWQYDSAVEINKQLTPYETVGVVGFAGDILEQYFYHPTVPMQPADLSVWQRGDFHPEISGVVVSGTLIDKTSLLPKETGFKKGAPSRFLDWYRVVRDIFSVGQL